jgi:hypothetical protein
MLTPKEALALSPASALTIEDHAAVNRVIRYLDEKLSKEWIGGQLAHRIEQVTMKVMCAIVREVEAASWVAQIAAINGRTGNAVDILVAGGKVDFQITITPRWTTDDGTTTLLQ